LVSWLVADARHPPFAPSTFDIVIAANLVHVCGPPAPVLQMLAELVRPGGRLMACWPADGTGPSSVLRQEWRTGLPLGVTLARYAVRSLLALSAATVGGGLVRTPFASVLTGFRSVAAGRGLRYSHTVVLGGLQHLVVLDYPANTDERSDNR
jgi:SAM-dependent methyltransferase